MNGGEVPLRDVTVRLHLAMKQALAKSRRGQVNAGQLGGATLNLSSASRSPRR